MNGTNGIIVIDQTRVITSTRDQDFEHSLQSQTARMARKTGAEGVVIDEIFDEKERIIGYHVKHDGSEESFACYSKQELTIIH